MGQGRPISASDVDVFVSWLHGAGFSFASEIENTDVLEAFAGFTNNDLRWLCAGLRQVNPNARLLLCPDPPILRRAILSRDVALLRFKN